MKQKRKTRNRHWWADELSKCAKSGLSLAEYARQNNLNIGTIYKRGSSEESVGEETAIRNKYGLRLKDLRRGDPFRGSLFPPQVVVGWPRVR